MTDRVTGGGAGDDVKIRMAKRMLLAVSELGKEEGVHFYCV